MNEELDQIKNEWLKEVEEQRKKETKPGYEETQFLHSKDSPYTKMAKKYEKKIKEVKEKYKSKNNDTSTK